MTPYQFASDRPIDGVDLDGKEWELSTTNNNLKTKAELYHENAQNQMRIPMYAPKIPDQYLIQWRKPVTKYEKERQEFINQQYHVQNGYNPDGTKPPLMRLAENKTWNKFADNLALPLLEGYSYITGIGELRGLIVGVKIINFPTSVSKVNYLRTVLHIEGKRNIGMLEGQIGNTKNS